MRVKVTKKMSSVLNKAAKDKPLRFEYRELPYDAYSRTVTYDVFRSYDWGDFDDSKGVFRFIACVYPDEYYAMPQYLTTYDLHNLFSANMTVDDFTARVIDAMQI